MLTKKQIELLPKGSHSNTKLSKMFEEHCMPEVGRKKFNLSRVRNRRQRKTK